MTHVSREGRKAQIFRILQKSFKQKQPCGMTVGQVARRLGLKSSTHLKAILNEMVKEYEEIGRADHDWGTEFSYTEYKQLSFFSRGVTINGSLVAVNDFYDRVQGSHNAGH